MRGLPQPLLLAQQAASGRPALSVEVGDFTFSLDELSTCSNVREIAIQWSKIPHNRILGISHDEEPYRQNATVTFNNFDSFLTGESLEGSQLIISYGFYTSEGTLYSRTSPLRVMRQVMITTPGKFTCELECEGGAWEMAGGRSKEEWMASTEPISLLIDYILRPQRHKFLPYIHCHDYTIVWGELDDLINTITPGESFYIPLNWSRLAAVRRLLDHTYCVMRFGADGRIYIFKPQTSGEEYDYEYSRKGGHALYSKAKADSLTLPNYIIVQTPVGADPAYYGEARDMVSFRNLQRWEEQVETIKGLESNDQAQSVAQAILSKVQGQREVGNAFVPMNCGQEIYDRVKVTDEWDKTEIEGNVGVIHRLWQPGKYTMSVTFGGWLSHRKVLEEYEVYPSGLTYIGSPEAPKPITPTWTVGGEVSVGTNAGPQLYAPSNMQAFIAIAGVKTALTGADLVIDINYNGESIFPTQKLMIPAGSTFGWTSTFLTKDIGYMGVLTIDIDQGGGSDLTVELMCRPTA